MNNDQAVSFPEGLSVTKLGIHVLPSILVYLMISVYGIADTILIDRFVNDNAIAAVNIFLPVCSLIIGMGYMIGTGANAAAMRAEGEGSHDRAQNIYSQILTCSVIMGVVLAAVLFIFRSPVMELLGSTDDSAMYVQDYFSVCLCFMPVLLLSCVLNLMLIGEGEIVTVAMLEILGGLTNCILDAFLMGYWGMGIGGAALATGCGYLLQMILAIILIRKKSVYSLRPAAIIPKQVAGIFFNGISELLSSISTGIMTAILNNIAGTYWNAVGVSVVCVMSNITYMVSSVFMGMVVVIEPMIAFFFGQKNVKELKNLIRNSIILIAFIGIISAVSVFAAKGLISGIFFEQGQGAFPLCVSAIAFAAASYVFTGFAMFVSGLFTGLSNGKVSGTFSFLRSLLLYALIVFILVSIYGGDGLWPSVVVSEFISSVIGIFVMKKYLTPVLRQM